ncbi:MAG: glycerol-3-phosphate 1-O-acyltransferase PlsY [Chthoniobacterales bacterium]
MTGLYFIAVFFISYLIGSIPGGFLIGRAHGVDLRKEGSGNVGATNALRVLGKKWGYMVFAIDFLKGVFSVLLACHGYFLLHNLPAPDYVSLAGITAAVACVLGHNFPVWLKFKGGKGISTSGGIIIALYPWQVFAGAITSWMVLFFTTRYVSIASIAASLALPGGLLVLFLLGKTDAWLLGSGVLLCAIALWRHRSNIVRLFNGTEPRFTRKKKDAAE